eukprot:Clim_evm5s252 gene=Clim_evmTU5s252
MIGTRLVRMRGPPLVSLRRTVARQGARTYSTTTGSVDLQFTLTEAQIDSYEEEGVPLIICHGMLGNRANWKSLSKSMSRKPGGSKRAIYAVDMRNHGESPHREHMCYDSMADDIASFIERHSTYKRAIVLGHSMGGKTVMHLALRRPELITALIVADVAPVKYQNFGEMEGYMLAMLAADLNVKSRNEIAKQIDPVTPNQTITQFLLTNLAKDDETDQFYWRSNVPAILKNLPHVADWLEIDTTYDGPTLFLGGSKADYITKDKEPKIKQLFPEMELKYLDAGHWLHAERPQQFVSAVNEFLEEIDES